MLAPTDDGTTDPLELIDEAVDDEGELVVEDDADTALDESGAPVAAATGLDAELEAELEKVVAPAEKSASQSTQPRKVNTDPLTVEQLYDDGLI